MALAKIKTVPTTNSVTAYLSKISDRQRKQDCTLLSKIMKQISGEQPRMWGTSIIGFGIKRIKSASGREVEWMRMGFSSRKEAISIYFTCDLNQVTDLLSTLGPHKRGVGCLYIKRMADIDTKVLEKMLKLNLPC